MDVRLGLSARGPSNRFLEKVSAATIAGSFQKASELLRVLSELEVSAKTVQRQSEAMGELMGSQEEEWRRLYKEKGVAPLPMKKPELLVITMDGGRVQLRGGEEGGQWKENKIGVVYNTVAEPEKPGITYQGPSPIERTVVATMKPWEEMVDRLSWEAERRGMRRAKQTVVIGDGAAGVKGVWQTAFWRFPFILDWSHAVEHLHACAEAAFPRGVKQEEWFERQKEALWNGQVIEVQKEIARLSKKVGEPPAKAAETDPRLVLKRNTAYFRDNIPHMDYPTYRKKGWPIGSGIIESTVKQVGKRVKGTEKFWGSPGAESTHNLLAYFLSEDGRWNQFWNHDIQKLRPAV